MFTRPKLNRVYRKIFYIFIEGEQTERVYFNLLKQKFCSKTHLEIYPCNRKTSAKQILQKAKKFISTTKLKKGDAIWVVLDIDENDKNELELILSWKEENESYGVAISNPKFEFWLLLHFEEGNGVTSSRVLDTRLEKHFPNYDKKNFDVKKLESNIQIAIVNAKNKYKQCKDWRFDNHSTVFLLVERILENENIR